MVKKQKEPSGKIGKLVRYVHERGVVVNVPNDLGEVIDKAIEMGVPTRTRIGNDHYRLHLPNPI